MGTKFANKQNNKKGSSFPNTPKKTTYVDPAGGRTIAYGETIYPGWAIGMGDTDEKYIVPISDLDNEDYSRAKKIDAPEGGEYDYGSKFVMRGNKIISGASDKDVMNYPDHISGKKAGDLGSQMSDWAKNRWDKLTYEQRKAEAEARYKAIQEAEEKEAREELEQIKRENK